MSRIIGGSARGRKIDVPSSGTRPTSDRAREGLFSTLTSLLDLEDSSVLDLYSGSGAIGLEALSRGAASAIMVESDARAANTIRANLAHLKFAGGRVVQAGVSTFLQSGAKEIPAVIFLDPPYDHDLAGDLRALLDHGWLGTETVVCVERASRDRTMAWPDGMAAIKERRYGIATLWYGRRS